MHVHLRRLGAVAFLATASALLSAACVLNEGTIFIRGCLVPDRTTCTAQASTTGAMVLHGTIDGVYASQYTCLALLENQMVARGDINKLRTETSRVGFYRADVRLLQNTSSVEAIHRSDGSAAEFSVPLSGFADPGTGTTPGLGLASIVLLDSQTVQDLVKDVLATNHVQTVVASAVVRGRTLGGLEIYSGEFKFPIDIFAGSTCVPAPGDTCGSPAGQPAADCEIGVDAAVDCRHLDPCRYLSSCTKDAVGKPNVTTAQCPSTPGFGDGSCCG